MGREKDIQVRDKEDLTSIGNMERKALLQRLCRNGNNWSHHKQNDPAWGLSACLVRKDGSISEFSDLQNKKPDDPSAKIGITF